MRVGDQEVHLKVRLGFLFEWLVFDVILFTFLTDANYRGSIESGRVSQKKATTRMVSTCLDRT